MSDDTTATGAGTEAGTPTPPTAPATGAEAAGFSQDDLNRILADERRKWKAQADAQAAAEKAKAAEDAAAKAGEWQSLAEQRATRLADIEREATTLREQHAALVETVTKQVKAALKELPEPIRALAPSGGNPAELLAWIEQARTAAASLTPPTGTPPGPRGMGGTPPNAPGGTDTIEQQKRTSGRYTPL